MILIQGNKAMKQARADKRKARFREIMLESNEPAKVFHAAVRWYGMREKWETHSKAEFILYRSMLLLLAQEFSPEWVAREFPAVKEYRGHTCGSKDYYTSMEALRKAIPFDGDKDRANCFLWAYDNDLLREFVVAGLCIVDELRAIQGQVSMMEEWANENGLKVYHSFTTEDGKEIMLDADGQPIGRMRKPHRHIQVVR